MNEQARYGMVAVRPAMLGRLAAGSRDMMAPLLLPAKGRPGQREQLQAVMLSMAAPPTAHALAWCVQSPGVEASGMSLPCSTYA